jgi:hypothetical protein
MSGEQMELGESNRNQWEEEDEENERGGLP